MKCLSAAAVLFVCSLTMASVFAASETPTSIDPRKETQPLVYTNACGQLQRYRLAVPANETKPAPLVLFFHGSGERGTDNTRQVDYYVKPLLEWFAARKESVYLVAPQCLPNTSWSQPRHHGIMTAPVPLPCLDLSLQLTEHLIRTRNVDPTRVYVVGVSMGGYGAWDALARRPDLFAGGMPVCGGGDTSSAARLRRTPVLVVHGERDGAVPTLYSRNLVAALRLVNAPVRYIEVPDCGHDSFPAAFKTPGALEWLFSRRRTDVVPRLPYLTARADETDVWEVAADKLTPAAYLERLRACGETLRQARVNARLVVRRDLVGDEFAKALDALGEAEEYEYRDGAAKRVIEGQLTGRLLCAGSGRGFLLDTNGVETAVWPGGGNITCVERSSEDFYWSNGAIWKESLADGERKCIYRPANVVGAGALAFERAVDGSIVLSVNSTQEVFELAPPRTIPPQGEYRERVRFKVDARDRQGKMPGAHGALRLVHKTAKGTYLVCCAGAACVREYDAKGTLVWEQSAPPFVFDCARRANGNTLVSHLTGVTEFTPDHRVAWQVTCADFPKLRLNNICAIQERANGNLVLGTWNNGTADRSRATACEITRGKKLVWAYFGTDLNLMSARILD